MDGILLINKEQGCTSFDVVAKLRGILKTRKIGHTGTLDPMAEGLLVVLVGSATPLCDILLDDKKVYEASFSLGIKTDTEDIWGNVTEKREALVNEQQLRSALEHFTGEIMQIPPMYSAIKIGGKKLCDLAREGKEIERAPRKIRVDSIELLSYDETKKEGSLKIACRKGTYIRTLIKDIGDFVGSGGTMTGLKRLYSNGFSLENAITISQAEALAAEGLIESRLIAVCDAFKEGFVDIEAGSWQAGMIENGVKLKREKMGNPPDGFYRIWHKGKFLCACQYEENRPNLKMIFKGK